MKSVGLLLLLTAQASASSAKPVLESRPGKVDEPMAMKFHSQKKSQHMPKTGRTFKPKAIKKKVSDRVSTTVFPALYSLNGYGLWVSITTPVMGTCTWGTFSSFRIWYPDAVNSAGQTNTGCLGGATSADMENWIVYMGVNGCAELADNNITFLGAARYPSAVGKGGMGYMFYNEYTCAYDATPGICTADADGNQVTNYGGRGAYTACQGEECFGRMHAEPFDVWATGKDQWISTAAVSKDPATYETTGEFTFIHCLEEWTRTGTWCYFATWSEDGLSSWSTETAFWPEETQQWFTDENTGEEANIDWYRSWMQLDCAGNHCVGASYWWPNMWTEECAGGRQITYRYSSDGGATWGDVVWTEYAMWGHLGEMWESYTPCGASAPDPAPYTACGGTFNLKMDYYGGMHIAVNTGIYDSAWACDYRNEMASVAYCYSEAPPSGFSCSMVGGTGPSASMADTWKVDLWESNTNLFRHGALQLEVDTFPSMYVVTMKASHAETTPDAYDPCNTFIKGPEWNYDLYGSQSFDGGQTWETWEQLTDTIYYTSPDGEVNADYMGDEWAPRLGGCSEGKCVILYTVPDYSIFGQPTWADNVMDIYIMVAEFAAFDDCDEGDMNEDGVHNVADIVLLVTKILENA